MQWYLVSLRETENDDQHFCIDVIQLWFDLLLPCFFGTGAGGMNRDTK